MSDLANEQFIHFTMCMQRLNNAWTILKAVKAATPGDLVGPAFRFALVDYAAPYTRSDGPLKRHILGPDFVPPEHLALHKRILDSRHQVHAHSDLTLMEAKLYIQSTRGKPAAMMSHNIIDELEELPNIAAIIAMVEGTLLNMYARQDSLLLELQS